jgi:hypothetical protein
MNLAWNAKWGESAELGTHRNFVSNPRPLSNLNGLELGHVISFMYRTEGDTTSLPRLAFVMHPNFRGKCHALTLKYIDRDDLLEKVYPHILVGLQDPKHFYEDIYKPTLYRTNAYRTFLVEKMQSITQFEYSAPTPDTEEEIRENYVHATEEDRAVMWDLFKAGKSHADVLKYYRTVVVPRQLLKGYPIATDEDKKVMHDFYKRGFGIEEVEHYYKTVVLKRPNPKSDV